MPVLVQKVVSPGGDTSWTVVDECFGPLEPVEVYLAHLEAIERFPNTLRAYPSSLRPFFEFLAVGSGTWMGTMRIPANSAQRSRSPRRR